MLCQDSLDKAILREEAWHSLACLGSDGCCAARVGVVRMLKMGGEGVDDDAGNSCQCLNQVST